MPVVMKFAHSVMFALPRITAPASRSRVTRKASRGAMQSCMAAWCSMIVAPHGSPSGVAATRAILSHAKLLARRSLVQPFISRHSALRRFSKLRLDLVAGLHVLQRLFVGLELVGAAVLLTDGHPTGALVDGHHLSFHLLGRLSAVLAVGLRLTEREPGREERGRREHTREHEPALHRIHPLLVVLGDVVDRAGRRADAQTDQRALPGSVAGSGADGRAATGAHGGSRRGAAPGGRETQ